MKRYAICLILLAFVTLPFTALAVEKADFQVQTTESLLDLCTASPGSDLYEEAINFCHGYLIGAYHYHKASKKGPNAKDQICEPDPAPTRNQTIDMFVAWAKANPRYHTELPVETEFRFLMETWPCSQ